MSLIGSASGVKPGQFLSAPNPTSAYVRLDSLKWAISGAAGSLEANPGRSCARCHSRSAFICGDLSPSVGLAGLGCHPNYLSGWLYWCLSLGF